MEGDAQDTLVVALCGQKLVSQAAYLLSLAAGNLWGVENRGRVRISSMMERAYYTLEEYIDGVDGCEAIDCKGCRTKMDAAIQRHFS